MNEMVKPAASDDGIVTCDACPVLCRIRPGRTGACDRYGNANGTLARLDPFVVTQKIAEKSGAMVPFAGKDWEDKRPRDRYVAESRRLLKVLEQHLAGRAWMLGGDYSIADIATWPWVNNLVGFYGAGELVGFAEFANVTRVLDAFLARPAVQRGLKIPLRN